MRKRSVRVAVFTLLVVATLTAAVYLWEIQRRGHELTAVEDALVQRIDGAISRVGAIGTAQQGYVAPGQLDDPWFERMSTLLDELNRDLAAVRPVLRSADAAKEFTALTDSLSALVAADQRIRENLNGGQELMAADVIFSDGRNIVEAISANLREIQSAERTRTRLELAALDREHWTVLGLAALVWLAVMIALIGGSPSGVAQSANIPEKRETTPAPSDKPVTDSPPIDLAVVAALCTDLSRVTDTNVLSELLGRAASLLDASGVTLWLGAGEQLFAVLGHGYTPQTLARFGPIARDADNAVARAWRTGHAATIHGNRTAGGAIVAPMFGPHGCIGVLAVENRPGREFDSALQPITAMIAAQVATAVSAWPAASVPQPVPDASEARPA